MSRDVAALVLAFVATVSVFAVGPALAQPGLDEVAAKSEAATYLSSTPTDAERVAGRWAVSDGADRAWLDAQTGELVEIEFDAR
jgi:hypothetical protein